MSISKPWLWRAIVLVGIAILSAAAVWHMVLRRCGDTVIARTQADG